MPEPAQKPFLNSAATTPIRVAIVDDDEELRQSLRWLINDSEGFKCVGTYLNCAGALKGVAEEKPDVVLMDIGLGGQSGIDCVFEIKQRYPEIHVIMQTVYSDDEKIFESLRAGAVGYLLKRTPTEKLLQAIRDAMDGGAPMTGEIARRVLSHFQQPKKNQIESLLSDREVEVLNALTKGHSYQAIADQLFISVNTVRFHIRNIYEKLHVKSRSQAVARVMKGDLL
jgi:DNA-binding NarL/FixJ family response regulator